MSDEMVFAKEWLSSNVTLCELSTGTVDQPEHEQGLRDAIFNSSSFPPPAYQRTSVLNSLAVYTQVLRQARSGCIAGGRRVGVNQRSRDPSPEGINRFAHSLAGDILQSARGQWGTAQTEGSQPRDLRMGPHCDHASGGTDPREMGLIEGLRKPERLSCTILKSVLEEVAEEGRSLGPRPMGWVSQAKTVEVFGGWRAGCRLEQGSLSCFRLLQDQCELEANMNLCEESHQSKWSPRCASKGQQACWSSVQEDKMEDRSGQWCFPGSPPNVGASNSILAHTGLPRKGSLDYPDAPPTTPLLPEMIKSHGSFHRKLKGGLAKEFLPSPPPPTPKHLSCISEEERLGLRDDRAEFVARLMRSLSLECSERGMLGVEEEWADGVQSAERSPQEMARLSAYATQLTAKIISSATTSSAAHFEAQVARTDPGKWLQLAAEQWANEVLAASFLELVKEKETGRVGSRPLVQAQQMAERHPPSSLYPAMQSDIIVGHGFEDIASPESRPALKSPLQSRNQEPHATWIEDLCSFAGQLIADILVQALAEPGTPNLGQFLVQDIAEKLCDSIVTEAVITATWQQRARWMSPGSSEECCSSSNGRLGASISPQPGLVEAVVKDSMQEAVRLRPDLGITRVSADQDLRLGNSTGSEVRVFLDKYACLGVQELQGMLLWATASNLGSPTLHLAVPDVQLQTELSMLANRALQVGWTVGDLITSLWQYCELEDNLAASGHSRNDTSLLNYLQEKLMEEMTD
ncbi:hypothetical protein SKAU_G00227790 [Synaphobranchus kaupii]|uniref:Uncharacterized protein n=1 Tax=Synaphobranchus kaupii TaxID=118154 RepID=A0A9Q1F520_SYNKA|nr:hypothetical protein SKAU_G00227790 [Synaphobranchus kaupii]